ncbi:phenylalanine--tRNA ligase subunit beta [Candidatus Microgenomates bacterium]|nr:MAG: phenylalanine--tRNA ligase subunit beta [Candidatus Microgenomates bacterium]
MYDFYHSFKMNIQILDSWLRQHLDTKASYKDIAKYVSLCGPSFEKTTKIGNDFLYDIEITTNRVDAMSVRGVAREAAAILPRFGIEASLKPLETGTGVSTKLKEPDIKISMDKTLTKRLMGVVFADIKNWESPPWMVERLRASNVRSLSSVVDITNYVMLEIGHPTHVFDFDRLTDKVLNVRESRKGEKIVSLEGKEYSLHGGDVVFTNSKDEIFDLPGVIGTGNSIVNKGTKTVLFFLDNIDPTRIRQTSMGLGIRTNAAILNEKGVDPELAEIALKRGIKLFETVCKAKQISKIFDLYPKPYRPRVVKSSVKRIEQLLGIELNKKQTTSSLVSLGFGVDWSDDTIAVTTPSSRANDIFTEEDIAEEIARIYGYHNIPSILMQGKLPVHKEDEIFAFERQVRTLLVGFGGSEILTQALTSKAQAGKGALRLVNPLGADREYLRSKLQQSLVEAVNDNFGRVDKLFLFEIANVYVNRKNKLPEERLTLAGALSGYSYREAKGVVDALLSFFRIETSLRVTEMAVEILFGNRVIGRINKTASCVYFEFAMRDLLSCAKQIPTYIPISKYPAQTEDITLDMSQRVYSADIIKLILTNKYVAKVEVRDIFENYLTLRISYHDNKKTLTDSEVAKIRNKILAEILKKYSVKTKG